MMGKEETPPENKPLESAENGKTNKRCIEGSKKLPAKGSSSNGDDVHEKGEWCVGSSRTFFFPASLPTD